ITLYKSYDADYQRNRLRLIGYDFADTESAIRTEVRERLTVDADREGIQTFINHQINAALTDVQTLRTFLDQKLRQALLDLQSYITPFRVGHTTSYLHTDATQEL